MASKSVPRKVILGCVWTAMSVPASDMWKETRVAAGTEPLCRQQQAWPTSAASREKRKASAQDVLAAPLWQEHQPAAAADEKWSASCEDPAAQPLWQEQGQGQVPAEYLQLQRRRGRRGRLPGRLLAVADALLASLVIAPLVVTTWVGVWTLEETHQLPAVPCFLAALAVHLTLALIQDYLPRRLPARSDDFRTASRGYTLLLAVMCITQWRSGWATAKPLDLRATLLLSAVCLVALLCVRSTKGLLTPPFFVFLDRHGEFFAISTRFRTSRSQHGVLWVLDCAFSVLVVGNLIVFTWRGVWTLLDLYLYPDDQLWSAIASLVLGYGVVLVAFALQLPLSLAVGRLQGASRLLAADLYHLVSFFGTVNVWRGVWNVLEIFLLEEYPELGCWVCATLPLFLLMLLGCGNSVLVRGVFIDGEEPGGRCIIFPCKYLRAYLQDRKQKKREKRRQQLAEQMVNSANHATSLPTFVNPPETTL
ncbi:uncharacterized protein LOC126278683 isoform X1 [Schistocerca gregaria]|uniref:uncharacterized protein LOC126278683 isoform X1 n=1 Tax=Schistocerca gregaria TaxID=7010 RepID=UPI00211E831C|nr:uncharacterized protein LOC126278683 isoform X1 [Schistocerca gregaria]